jgi:hypothetical protein
VGALGAHSHRPRVFHHRAHSGFRACRNSPAELDSLRSPRVEVWGGDRDFNRYFGQPSKVHRGQGGGVNDPGEGGELCHRVGYDSAMLLEGGRGRSRPAEARGSERDMPGFVRKAGKRC